ncbi:MULTISPECIES: hypothetical protein [unclassified Streptomyces]|uniref:hypothetical protein n=1 Tax=unclassified Streptomyces TaxID=2593676 RepID=UPI0006FD15E7|nr:MULTISPECIES: hypothetical protein [unclassified Streptomyces]KQX58910.1 hypothetical protein ASD33_00940 [Streptomyces sp. Root1304]KRB00171.1 hypothetical protein ASE09_00940 [Streptomyces sp. Root66D1]
MPRWVIVMLVVTGALVVLVPVGGIAAYIYASGKNHENMRFPSDDVTVARCAVDPATGRPVADLSVTSGAVREGTFTVTVEFQDEREKAVDRGVGVVRGLAVGATGRTTVVGAEKYRAGSPRCVVYDAEFASTDAVTTP